MVRGKGLWLGGEGLRGGKGIMVRGERLGLGERVREKGRVGEGVREKGRVGEREGVGLEIITSCSEV